MTQTTNEREAFEAKLKTVLNKITGCEKYTYALNSIMTAFDTALFNTQEQATLIESKLSDAKPVEQSDFNDAERYRKLKTLALTPQEIKTFAISKFNGMHWDCYEGGIFDLDVSLDAISASPNPSQSAPCKYCDDTGDVHRADGEWLGECNCNQPNIEQSVDVSSEREKFEAWYKKDNGETQMTRNSDKHYARPDAYIGDFAQSAWEGWQASAKVNRSEVSDFRTIEEVIIFCDEIIKRNSSDAIFVTNQTAINVASNIKNYIFKKDGYGFNAIDAAIKSDSTL
jgi:hypothetical protein